MTENSKYIGRMRQPLQLPHVDKPSMFMVKDTRHCELDLIILTPGVFSYAYDFIIRGNFERIRIFIPSCGIEFISDLYNLYKELYGRKDIQWVFPKLDLPKTIEKEIYPKFESTDFTRFIDGQIKKMQYHNPEETIWVSYIKNLDVYGLYDIVARTDDETNYFTLHITESRLYDLYENNQYDLIHVPYSVTMYNGMNFKQILKLGKKFREKLVPYSFSCIEEFYESNERRDTNGII